MNITSPSVDVEAVRAAIISRDESEAETLGDAQLRAVVIDTSQVADWYRQAQSILITDLPQEHKVDWIYAYADLDETVNQALIGYATEEARDWAQQKILDEIAAPPGVIVAYFDENPPQPD